MSHSWKNFLTLLGIIPWIIQPVVWSLYTVHYPGSLTSDTAALHNFKTWTIHTASHNGYTTLSTGQNTRQHMHTQHHFQHKNKGN
jgi:hypothetical protein